MSRRLLALVVALAACGKVDPSNPYDPASLSPADGRLQGSVVTEGFAPLEGAVVSMLRDSDGVKYEAVTGADGTYGQDLKPGSYFLQVSATGYETAAIGRIRVAAGVRTVVAEVALKLGRGELQGTVALAGGASPEGTTLTLIPLDDQGTPPAVLVGASGEYSVQGLAVGRYKIRASKQEYWPAYSSEQSVMPMVIAEVPELELGDGQAVVRTEIGGVVGARYTNERDVRLLLFTFGQLMEGMRLSEDKAFRDEAAGDIEHRSYKAEETFTLADADGEHTVFAQFRDQLGLETPAYATSVILDRVPPRVTSMQVGDGSGFVRTGDGATTLTLTASDDLAGVGAYTVSTDGAFDEETWLAVESNRLEVVLPDVLLALGPERGVRPIRVKVRDLAGNESEVSAVDVLVDGLAPTPRTPAIVIDEGATTVHSLEVQLGVSVDGDDAEEQLFYALANGAGIPDQAAFLSLDRTSTTTLIPWTLASGDDGLRTVCLKVKDAAGNLTEELCADVTVDRTGTLSGTVALEGAPSSLAGVNVTATNDALPTLLRTTTTDDKGAWELSGLPSGTGYTVTFARDGYVTDRLRGLSVLAGREVEAGSLSLNVARGSVAGTLELNDRVAGEHGGISVSALNTPYATTTSPTGDFLLEDVPVGVYEIVGRAQGYLSASYGSVTVEAGRTTRLTPTLQLRKQSGQFAICLGTDTDCVQGAVSFTSTREVRLRLASTSATQYRASSDETFEGVDYQPLTDDTTYPFELPEGADGVRTVYVQYRAADGEEQAVLEGSVSLDTTPPSGATVLVDGGAAFTNDAAGRVELTVSADDALSGVGSVVVSNDETFDETPTTFASKLTHFLTAEDGAKTVRVRFCDRVGNCTDEATSAQAAISLDTAAPGAASGASVSVNDGDARTASSVVTVAITTGDAVRLRFGTTETLVGATWIAVEPGQSLTFETAVALGDGEKSIYAQFADAAGNESGTSPNPFVDTIILDTQSPTAPSVSIAGNPANAPANGYTNQATVPLVLSAQGAPTQMQLVVGELEDFSAATWETFSAAKTLALPGEGSWRIYARFRDAAHNVSATASTALVRDLTAPTAPVLVVNDGQTATNANPLRVKSSSSGADFMRVACAGSPDALPWVAYSPDFLCNASTQGLQTITAQYSDRAGNVSESVVGTITYDTVKPGAPTITDAAQVLNALPANLSWTAGASSTDIDRWRVQIAGTPSFNPLSTDDFTDASPMSLEDYGDGRWFWRVAGVDAAGNPGDWSTPGLFVLDRVAPGVAQLSVLSRSETSVTLRVLPPGDDDTANPLGPGSSFDVRYAVGTDAGLFDWDTATQVSGEPAPKGLGQEQAIVIGGLTKETSYLVAMKTTDDAGNVSALSEVLVTTTPDETPPSRPTGFQASAEPGHIALSWVQPGDDGNQGQAHRHLVYFTDGPLEDERDFERAFVRLGPVPGTAGSTAEYNLTGLDTNKTYSIAVAALDEAGNASLPSVVRSVSYSAVLKVRPVVAGVGDVVELDGLNLGTVPGRVVFGGVEAERIVSWSDDLVRVEVPVAVGGDSKLTVATLFGGRTSQAGVMGLAPKMLGVYPSELLLGNPTFVSGSDFGSPGQVSRLLLGNGREVKSMSNEVTQWVDDAVTFTQAVRDDAGIYPLRVQSESLVGPVTSRAAAYRVWKPVVSLASGGGFTRQIASHSDGRIWLLVKLGVNYHLRVSDTHGETFSPAENVATAAGGVQNIDTVFALDETGKGHFCYIKRDSADGPHTVYYRSRTAFGTWSTPVAQNLVGGVPMAGAQSQCRIAVGSGANPRVWLTWQVGRFLDGSSSVRVASYNPTIQHRDLCDLTGCGVIGEPSIAVVADDVAAVAYREQAGDVGSVAPEPFAVAHIKPSVFLGLAHVGTAQLSSTSVRATAHQVERWRSGVRSLNAVYSWVEETSAGTHTAWVARSQDFTGRYLNQPFAVSYETVPDDRKTLVDDYASDVSAPQVAGTSEGDLSVLVLAGEGPLLRHHLYRATDGLLGDDVAGDEISGLVQSSAFAVGAGPQAGQILVTTQGEGTIEILETRLPSQQTKPRLLSASPDGVLAPVVASNAGVTHVVYFEQDGANANLRYASFEAAGMAEVMNEPLASWPEDIDGTRGICNACESRVAVIARPDGTASGVWWEPGNGNELTYCADLSRCSEGAVAIATAQSGRALWAPRLALDSKQTLHVVYEQGVVTAGVPLSRDPTTSELWYVTVDKTGEVSTPFNVAPEPGGKSDAAIVIDRADTLHVFYRLLHGADAIRVRSLSPGKPETIPTELVRDVFPLASISAALGARGIELAWMRAHRTLVRAAWNYGWVSEPEALSASDSMTARIETANDGQIFLLEEGGAMSSNRFIPADDIHQVWGSPMHWARFDARGYGGWAVDRVSGEVTLVYFDATGRMVAASYRSLGQ